MGTKGRVSSASVMMLLVGWTATNWLRRMNLLTNRKKLKLFVIPSLPSFIKEEKVVCQEVCLVVCLVGVCLEGLVLAVVLELALPLRRSTNVWISKLKSIIEKNCSFGLNIYLSSSK